MQINTKQIRNRIRKTLRHVQSAVSGLTSSLGSVAEAVSLIKNRSGKIVLTGVGKSAYVGMKIAATITSLGNHASFLHPVDALHGDTGIVSDGDVIIAISASGESQEIVKIVKHLKKIFSIQVVSITANKKSTLAKQSDVVIHIKISEEGSPHNVAPMASTTASMVVGDLIASGLVSNTFKSESFARFHPGGELGLKTRKIQDFMQKGKKVPIAKADGFFQKAINELNRKRKGTVALVNNRGVMVGVISSGDVGRFFDKRKSLDGVLAKHVMSKRPKIIEEGNSLKDALDCMQKWEITTLYVITKTGKPVGIIHMHDILDAVS